MKSKVLSPYYLDNVLMVFISIVSYNRIHLVKIFASEHSVRDYRSSVDEVAPPTRFLGGAFNISVWNSKITPSGFSNGPPRTWVQLHLLKIGKPKNDVFKVSLSGLIC